MTSVLDRSRPPAPGPVAPLVLPPAERRVLPNGLQIVHAEYRRLPLVSVSVVFLSGAAQDAPGREGVAELTANAMEEGAGSRTSAQMAEAIESLGARVSSWAGWDARGVSINALAPVAPHALALAADLLRAPAFPESEVDRLRTERLADIQQERTEPGTCATEAYLRTVAAGHRFAIAQGGTPTGVRALTREVLAEEHRARYALSGARVISVGAASMDEVARWVSAALPVEAHAPVAVPRGAPLPPAQPTRITFLERPGAVQSELRIGHAAPPRNTPDYFALLIMNTILGGCFNSRLMLNLRERNGYTYGAHARLDLRRSGGFFTASAAVQSEVTGPALSEFLFELNRLVQDGVTTEEVQYARDYVAGVFPSSFETTGDLAHQLLATEIHALPPEYLSTYQERVRAVTASDVLRVARAHVHPDASTVFVLGDRSALGNEWRERYAVDEITLEETTDAGVSR